MDSSHRMIVLAGGASLDVSLLDHADAAKLTAFYNSLAPATIRTFRPLGDRTNVDVCRQLAAENAATPPMRHDLLCRQGDNIAGWAFLANLHTDGPYLGIVVTDMLQGLGIGKTMTRLLMEWAIAHTIEKVYLMVVKDNQRAINLYKRAGFVVYDEEFDELDQLPYYHMVADLSTGKVQPAENV